MSQLTPSSDRLENDRPTKKLKFTFGEFKNYTNKE